MSKKDILGNWYFRKEKTRGHGVVRSRLFLRPYCIPAIGKPSLRAMSPHREAYLAAGRTTADEV